MHGLTNFKWNRSALYIKKQPVPNREQRGHIIMTSRLLFCREITVVYCKNHAEYVIVSRAYVLRTKSKVMCTLVQPLRLCKDCTAHRGSRGIALLFHNHGTRRKWGVSVTPRSPFTPRKDPMYEKYTSNCLVSEAEIARLREITSIVTCYSFGNPVPVISRMHISLIHVFYI